MKTKKLWTLAVLAVLLLSSIPMGLADVAGSTPSSTSVGLPSSSTSFDCDLGKLTYEEVRNLTKNVYGDGFQSRGEVAPGESTSLDQNVNTALSKTPEQIIREFNNKTDPNSKNASIKTGEIATPDGQRKFDYNSGCVDCSKFPFTSGTDTPYFAFTKDLTTRASYCEKGVDKCLDNISSHYSSSNGTLTTILSSFSNPNHDQLMATNDFKFYEKNGAFSPTDYDTLVYSNVQKIYDNWLPVATVASIFVPNPVGLLKKGISKIGSIADWFKTFKATEATKTAYQASRTLPYFGSKGSQIITTSPSIRKAFTNVDDLVRAATDSISPRQLDDLATDLARGLESLDDKVVDSALAQMSVSVNLDAAFDSTKIIKDVNPQFFSKGMTALKVEASQKGSKSITTLKNFYSDYASVNLVKSQQAAAKANILEALAKGDGRITDDVAREALEALGEKLSSSDKVLDILSKSVTKEEALPQLTAILSQNLNRPDIASQSFEKMAETIYDGYIRTTGDKTKYIKDLLKNYKVPTGGIEEIVANPTTYAEAYAQEAAKRMQWNLDATQELGQIETIGAHQQSKLDKLWNLLLGTTKTTKSTIARGIIYKAGFVYYVGHSPGDNIGSQQTVFSISQAAKDKATIENYLDGERPYIDILSHDSAHLEGWSAIFSYIHIPQIFNTWLSFMQARFAGQLGSRFGQGSEVKELNLESECRDDMYKVKDTAWVFRTGKDDERFVLSMGTMSLSLADANVIVSSNGTAHSYTTEVDNPDCFPTVILKTHGVNINSEVWQSNSLSTKDIINFFDSLSGKKQPASVKEMGSGVRFEDYVNPPQDEDRCTFIDGAQWDSLLSDAGFALLAQTIPLVDLATAPFISKNMGECIDKDYWVHMMVNSEQSGTDIIKNLFDFGSQGNTTTPVSNTTGTSPSGAVVAGEGIYEISKKTIEGISDEAPNSTPTGAASGSLLESENPVPSNLVIGGESNTNANVTYQGSTYGFLQKFLNLGDKAKQLYEQTVREQDVKRLNSNTFWFRGQYADGFYGALKVKKCCYINFAGNSYQLPMSSKVKERAMIDNVAPGKDKTVVEIIVKMPDGTPTLQVQKIDNNTKRTVLSKTDDMLRQSIDQTKTGTIIPYQVKEIVIDPTSKDLLFRTILGGSASNANIHAGDYGVSPKVTSIIDCITSYINAAAFKQYSNFENDRALAELGEINKIVFDNGVQLEKKGDKFILADPGRMATVSRIEIRVNREVLLDGIESGLKVEVVHTDKGQLMWVPDKDKLLVWLYKFGEAKGTDFSVDKTATEDLKSGKDSDGDGVPDDKEYALGLDPHNPDSGNTGVPDGQKDLNHNGIPDAEEVVCNFHGIALDLGDAAKDYMNMIGPVMSFETTDHTVTFIADTSSGACKKYVRMCERKTGKCADAEEIANIQVEVDTISINTVNGQLKLLRLGRDANGNPTLEATHTDAAGNVVQGPETFTPETIETIRGAKGIGIYDPSTGQWTFFNGFDIPRDPSFKDGMTIAPNINNSPTIMPGNMMGTPPKSEGTSAKNLLAELPWAPEGDQFLLFIVFLLMAALFIQHSVIKSKGAKRGKNGP